MASLVLVVIAGWMLDRFNIPTQIFQGVRSSIEASKSVRGVLLDKDGDGYGFVYYFEDPVISNSKIIPGDCNDGNPSVFPSESVSNHYYEYNSPNEWLEDRNCNGRLDTNDHNYCESSEEVVMLRNFEDRDGDNYAQTTENEVMSPCVIPKGYSRILGDWNDDDPSEHPRAPKCFDIADRDGDGITYECPEPNYLTLPWEYADAHPDLYFPHFPLDILEESFVYIDNTDLCLSSFLLSRKTGPESYRPYAGPRSAFVVGNGLGLDWEVHENREVQRQDKYFCIPMNRWSPGHYELTLVVPDYYSNEGKFWWRNLDFCSGDSLPARQFCTISLYKPWMGFLIGVDILSDGTIQPGGDRFYHP